MLFIIYLLGCMSDHYLSHGVVETEKEYIYVQDNYVEGESEPEWPIWVDSFIQPETSNGVDIIWAIDGSGSMSEEYPKVLQGISDMLANLPLISWRLMIISTTPHEAVDIEGLPLIPGDSYQDAVDMFVQNVQGTHENGFLSVQKFITENADAQQWLRSDATLLIVFVSDEDDASDPQIPTPLYFENFLRGYRQNVFVSSIINIDPIESACSVYTHWIGFRYIELTNAFNGNIIDICTEDWSQGVADASNQITPKEYLDLTYVPHDANNIYVFVDGVEFSDWTYDPALNRVVFSVIPPENSLVEIAYYY